MGGGEQNSHGSGMSLVNTTIICDIINVGPRWHSYLDVVVGLAWSYDPESYAGGSLLLTGSPMPVRSKVITQTKRDA